MISIRTGLVVAGFVGMALTSAVEYLATVFAEPEPFVAVDAAEAMPGRALRLTENLPERTAETEPAPWI